MFKSFFLAGFECTYALAEKGKRFDLLSASGHDKQYYKDYKMLYELGIKTVREGFSWSQIDKGNGVYDFSRFEPLIKAASEIGIQQIWDLNHFDFPEYLDPFSDLYSKAFGEYAKRVLELLRKYESGKLFITPINEISFFSWMSDNGLWAPYGKERGAEFKKQLVKGSISAMKSIWQEDVNVAFIHTDPYMFRQPLRKKNLAEKKFCEDFNENVRFQSWDMISGRLHPELGGEPKYLNILGVNYYFYNQQQVGINGDRFSFRSIALNNKIRQTLPEIFRLLFKRYKVPIMIAETGSYRSRREAWWKYVLEETDKAVGESLPILGVCAYPTLDIKRGAGFIIPQSGLFDFDQKDPTLKRIPHQPSLKVIQDYIEK